MPDFMVRDFGACGDGVTLDTAALQAAIDAAAVAGGRVIVPPGCYLTGTIVLKSRVTLDVQAGACLLGSPDIAQYQTHRWGHHDDITPWHLVLADGAEEITITGGGEIAGNGPAFWEPERPHAWAFWRQRIERVSPMVHLQNCRGVRIEQITLRESAGWTLHLHDCDDAVIDGVTIRNTFFGPNTDGIDLTGCHRVSIARCDISTGDDAIALKTSDYSRDCEDISIADCVLATSCVGIRIGYESRQSFRRITVRDCAIPRSSRLLDLRSLEGGDIEHVTISSITGTTNSGWPVNRPIEISLHRRGNAFKPYLHPGHPDFGKDNPVRAAGTVRDITLRGLDITTDGRVTLVADEGAWLGDILIEHLRLRYIHCEDTAHTAGITASNSYLPGDHADARAAAAAIVAKNVHNLTLRGLEITWPTYPIPAEWCLLDSPHHGDVDVERLRMGGYHVPYRAIWSRGVDGLNISATALTASDGITDAIDDK